MKNSDNELAMKRRAKRTEGNRKMLAHYLRSKTHEATRGTRLTRYLRTSSLLPLVGSFMGNLARGRGPTKLLMNKFIRNNKLARAISDGLLNKPYQANLCGQKFVIAPPRLILGADGRPMI